MKILEKKGYKVIGVDLSENMLNIARTRVTGDLIQQDMRNINLPDKYDAVLCLGGSFTHIQSDADVLKTLCGFYRHLVDGGVLIFDNFDRDDYKSNRFGRWKEETHTFDDVVVKRRSFRNNWNHEDGTWTVNYVWMISEEQEERTIQEQIRLKSYRYRYLQEFLHQIGFINVEKIDVKRFMIKAERNEEA